MNSKKFNILIAFKALTLVPGLSATDRRVAGALLDHYNRKTGQCDPSLDTIAALLGVHRRTVIRSISHLEKNGVFNRTRHGGNFHRNFYEPRFAYFLELENQWVRRRSERSTKLRREKMSPWQGQGGHHSGGDNATQTCLINHSKEIYADGTLSNAANGTSSKINSGVDNEEQRSSACIRGGQTFEIKRIRSHDAALASAERRWTNDLHQRFAHDAVRYGAVIEAVNEALQSAATDAELHKRGAGLALILARVGLR
jgi:predicted transcriptional regulator